MKVDIKKIKDENILEDLFFVDIIMMPKGEKNDNLFVFINLKFKNETLHNMNSSFTSKIIFQWFVMRRILNNFIHLLFDSYFMKENNKII